jgi:lysozyme
MNRIPAGPNVVQGIDLYHGNSVIDLGKIAQNNIGFVFLKAFEKQPDSMFQLRWKAAKELVSLIRGAYAFFHPNIDPIQQAQAFIQAVGPLSQDDLPCVLDWEVTDNVPQQIDLLRGLAWLQTVELATKKIPIIYGSPYFLQALNLDFRFARYGLWIAGYEVSAPLVPPPWNNWHFWQNSEAGTVPGVSGRCDTNLFNGTMDQLKQFISDSTLK